WACSPPPPPPNTGPPVMSEPFMFRLTSSERNTLRVRFRTSSTNGLLFLAAGQTDHLLLELHAGRLQVGTSVAPARVPAYTHSSLCLYSPVRHTHQNLTLTVDKNSHASLTMPSSRYDLHIADGLFVGGSGGLDRVYLPRDPTGFRGCMDEVVFNEHDVLSSLRPYAGFKKVYEVSPGCSPQFLATEEDPISFFSSRAYMSLPTWNAQQEAVFECVVHTSAKEGIILFNSAREGDFVAVEIQEGLPVAIIGKGGTRTELRSLTFVSDGKWHFIKLSFSSKNLVLTVDGEVVKNSLRARPKGFQLRGYLFVGGVDDSTRAEVKKVGLLSVSGKRVRGGSFKGCLRNIQINRVKMGLSNAIVTRDLSVGCEPEKEPEPATTVSPKTPPGSLLHIMTTTPSLQVSTLARGLDRRYGTDFIQLRNLVVQEGGRASLEAKHVKVHLDFKKLGIRQSQIMFKVVEQPVHGQVRLDVDPDQEQNTFSMLDLWHGRVMYIHGGSEEPEDFFIFSIYSSSRREVPDYLKEKRLYRYNITVSPTNDAPELSLPEGNLFVLLENTKKRLTTDVLKATDIDSNHTDLVFSVLGNLNVNAGYLELENSPGAAVASFSYVDLEELRVFYVHTGVWNSRIVLRVSDGEKVSNTVVLRVMAVALEYKVANNTGIDIIQGESVLIGSNQLAVQTNAIRQAVDIRYDMSEAPQYGELQRLHSSGEWRPTDSFSQRLLEKERLRYVSTFQEIQTSSAADQVKFNVTVAGRASTEVLFPITVKWVRYHLVRNVVLELDKIRKVTLDSDCLYATTEGVSLSEDDLFYRVLTIPKKGKLLLGATVLGKNSTFSQRDLTNSKVHYELVDRPHENITDRFKFQLLSKHAQSQNYDFQFSIKADANSVFLRNRGLSVLEGESKLITKDKLFAETLSTKDMHYTVTSSPKHGKLARISHSNSNASYSNILTFSNQDVLEERIMYIHDDSEATQDSFAFIASITEGFRSSITDHDVGTKAGTFNISVRLINDQKPVRVIDKVFHVVQDGQKLLTIEDLRYHDPDSDFDDSQLIYTRRGIPMGDLVLVNDTTHRLFQFQQKDLEEKRVLFIHKGASTGRFVLFVSDGKHFISSLLDISAREPFLKVANNTGLLVQKGQSVTIHSSNFSLESNLDIRDDQEVGFSLVEGPKYGELRCNRSNVDSFTQSDLKEGLISYQHDDSSHLADYFNLTVRAKDLQLTVRISVKVFLESHQRPPILHHHGTILVEEGKPVKIDDITQSLQVTHEDNLPSEIVFTVTVAPPHGFLRRFDKERYIGTKTSGVTTFTQEDINGGNIQYVQAEPNKASDAFVLHATNGVTHVRDIRMSVDIIPCLIPLQVTNITVKEGASRALTQDVLSVTSPHFSGINFLYSVIEPPQHGHVEHSRHPGVSITSFTRRQVEHEFIYYVHDGSETATDNFTVGANDTGLRKHSAGQTVHVQVTAVNDEPPLITANRVLRVWVSSVTEIRPEDLQAHDLDSPPEELHFMVTPPSNGHLALKSAPMAAVLNFTQAHIERGQLLFVHKGAMSGGFNFQVNDGVNFTPRQIFSITAQALVVSLERNRPLKVFPGKSSSVTNDFSNSSNRVITFNVIRQPKLGRLAMRRPDNSTSDISTFTQDMVRTSSACFSGTRTVGIFSNRFVSNVSLEDKTGASLIDVFWVTGAVVTEGESVVIDESKLDASNLMSKLPTPERSSHEVWFQVLSLPQHGVIVVGERNLTKEKPNFSQFIVNKYGITYLHDNSETTRDSFIFSAWINPKGKTAQRPHEGSNVVEERFNITILPVNDQPPLLRTKSPGLRVVQGDTVALKPEDLHVEDLDDPPEDIRFSVISKPNNGFLALEGRWNESIGAFTQAQINNGSIYFIHDGSTGSGVFYFSVTDGHHKPLYKLFNLEVTEITISLVNHSRLWLEQGKTFISLSQDHLAAQSNGKNVSIRYLITRPPLFGKVLKENLEVKEFEEEDLKSGKLSYHMTSVASAEDSFEFTAFTSEANLTGQVLNVTVAPLIQVGEGVRIPNGITVKLATSFLNASALAKICGSDPVFEIKTHPKYGKVVRPKPGVSHTSVPVQSFTFQEVVREEVGLELSANLTEVRELNDSFTFLLKADTVPPAGGELHFTVVPYDPELSLTTKSPVSATAPESQTPLQKSRSGTTFPALTTASHPTQQTSKNQQKFKGQSRWGNANRTSVFSTTLGKPTHRTEEHPFRNTPVRVESYPQKPSNPLLVILPLLALLLLVIIFVVLVVFLRHHRQRKQNTATPKDPDSTGLQSSQAYQAQAQRSPAVPTVTVTPLTRTSNGGPVLDRSLTPDWGYARRTADSNVQISSWRNGFPSSSSQVLHPSTPTLQKNQYWV
uniref:Chondroitin sulfate proteoglycan 4ba n=1 Tax=Takifugu rubripes TaxID=31033 RepID=H2V0B8_TAKRU